MLPHDALTGNMVATKTFEQLTDRIKELEAENKLRKKVTTQIQYWINAGATLSKQIDKTAIIDKSIECIRIDWEKDRPPEE